jgi:hypothetical protein
VTSYLLDFPDDPDRDLDSISDMHLLHGSASVTSASRAIAQQQDGPVEAILGQRLEEQRISATELSNNQLIARETEIAGSLNLIKYRLIGNLFSRP